MILPSIYAVWFGLTGAINQEGARQWAEVSARAAERNVALDLSTVRPPPVPEEDNVFGHPWLKAVMRPESPERTAAQAKGKAEAEAFHEAGRVIWKGHPDSFPEAAEIFRQEAPDLFPPDTTATAPGLANALLTVLDQKPVPWDGLLGTLPRRWAQLPPLGASPNPEDLTPPALQDITHPTFLLNQAGWMVAAHLAAGDPDKTMPLIQFQSRICAGFLQHPSLIRLLVGTSWFRAISNQARLGFSLKAWREEDMVWFENWCRTLDITKSVRAAMVAELGYSLAMADHTWQDPAFLDRYTAGMQKTLSGIRAEVEKILPGAAIKGLHDSSNDDTFSTEHLIRAIPPGALQLYKADLVRTWLDHGFRLIDENGLRSLMKADSLPIPMDKIAGGFLADEARIVLLQTACALHRYRQTHGAWPDRLVNLVPEFLPAVPVDPCSDAPLVYQSNLPDGGCRVYSFGKDRTDDTKGRMGRLDPRAEVDDIIWHLP